MTGTARAESLDNDGIRLWGFSGGLVLMLHASLLIATTVSWKTTPPPVPPSAPMVIDLAPLPAPTPAAPPKPVVTPPPKPVERKVVEPIKRPPPLAPKAEVALPKQVTPPVPTEAPPSEPTPPVVTPTPPAVPAKPSAAAIDARKSWQGTLLAHLERHKRYPRSAQTRRHEGVVTVRFVMNRQGVIVSSRLEQSGGSTILDDEGLALLERAQPLPSPPPEVKGDTIELVVPVEFFLR
ncbi:energy transducer TonB family protein [Magnetospirillum molischianum]|uniref:TonB family protein n=1 Tax=Magnetospirillum molischianum DSM 120 TaxID=1150626 RepID=H8FXI0_MAGML|nr:energy transducer TonB [Magnetospirillum molischianum]CCG43068.1 TonB family protein [Magnetospirillum molischianum DSM 120]